MPRLKQLKHCFVKSVPERLETGMIYVSMEYASVVHLCCCGCGSEIVTPLSPKDWKLTFDGESISLQPSIGNWSFPCRSHYWIKSDRVRWAGDMTQDEIREGREYDRWNRSSPPSEKPTETKSETAILPEPSFWRKTFKKLIG